MVHASRAIRGLRQPDYRIVGWDSVEDLYAIMLTNIYVSNNNRNADLRGDHSLPFHALIDSTLPSKPQMSDRSFCFLPQRYFFNYGWQCLICANQSRKFRKVNVNGTLCASTERSHFWAGRIRFMVNFINRTSYL